MSFVLNKAKWFFRNELTYFTPPPPPPKKKKKLKRLNPLQKIGENRKFPGKIIFTEQKRGWSFAWKEIPQTQME